MAITIVLLVGFAFPVAAAVASVVIARHLYAPGTRLAAGLAGVAGAIGLPLAVILGIRSWTALHDRTSGRDGPTHLARALRRGRRGRAGGAVMEPSTERETTMSKQLRGKSALVTGSTSGIGRAIATLFAAEGANVMLNGFGDAGAIEALRAGLAKDHGVKVSFHGADMSKPAEIRALVKQAEADFGAIDILVNNAGIQHVAPIDEFPEDEMGRDHRDQPVLGVPRDQGGASRHEAAPGGPHHQHCLLARAGRIAQQVCLRGL
jgi:hypothetical protein